MWCPETTGVDINKASAKLYHYHYHHYHTHHGGQPLVIECQAAASLRHL